jgi:hypothetical protein
MHGQKNIKKVGICLKRLKKFKGKLKVNSVDLLGTEQWRKHCTAMLSLFIWEKQNEREGQHKLFWAKYNCKPQGTALWWRLEFWETGLRTEFRYSTFFKKQTK